MKRIVADHTSVICCVCTLTACPVRTQSHACDIICRTRVHVFVHVTQRRRWPAIQHYILGPRSIVNLLTQRTPRHRPISQGFASLRSWLMKCVGLLSRPGGCVRQTARRPEVALECSSPTSASRTSRGDTLSDAESVVDKAAGHAHCNLGRSAGVCISRV